MCKKHYLPLPRIDQLVDTTASFEYLSSLDTYSRYHNTPMTFEDEEKIAFMMDKEAFCCRIIPFG